MFIAYNLLCKKNDLVVKDILHYPLFYNPNITIDGESIFIKSWFQAGVHNIGDLLTNDKIFYDLNEFNVTYGIKSNFLTYVGF